MDFICRIIQKQHCTGYSARWEERGCVDLISADHPQELSELLFNVTRSKLYGAINEETNTIMGLKFDLIYDFTDEPNDLTPVL